MWLLTNTYKFKGKFVGRYKIAHALCFVVLIKNQHAQMSVAGVDS